MALLPTEPDSTPTRVFNPDIADFIFQMADDDNVPHIYTFPAKEIVKMPRYIAEHGAKKLAEKLVWQRGIKTNYEADVKKILSELYLEI